jgi:hypothetical protein
MRPLSAALAVALAALASAAGAARAAPIPEDPATAPVPAFAGDPWAPAPVSLAEAPVPPRHPFMAPNDRSNLHDDAYQTDTTDGPGPLGRDMETLSTYYNSVCGSVTFDSRGRIVTICVGAARPVLKVLDPVTLAELASLDLPPRQSAPVNLFQDFAGGGYFYLDHRDRAVIPTTTRHIVVVAATDPPGLRVEADHDLSRFLASGDKIISALPDWRGLVWWVSIEGVVGTLDLATGRARALDTREPIGNSHAVDETGGVYVVTDAALYRFDAGPAGFPSVTWREGYPNTGEVKPGQTQRGSGTTPSLMGRDLVAITDNADPMHVMVLERAAHVGGPRVVCRHPVFERGASATDNSLIVTARSIVVENNHGYTGPAATMGGSTAPGVERIDLDADGRGCRRVWRSEERSPSVVPKLSLENGLVYLYTKDPDPNRDDPWYLTALDFRTGRTVFERLAGRGLGYNNNYAPITLGPDGTAYVGALGGLVALRDRPAPPRVRRPDGEVRLLVGLRGLRRPAPRLRARCARRDFTVAIGGRDRGLVRRVAFHVAGRRARVDSRAPFAVRARRRGLRRGRAYRVVARTTLRDGRRIDLMRTFRAC